MADIAPLITNPSRLPGIIAPALGAAPMLSSAPVMAGPSFADVATMARPSLPAISPVHNAALDTPVQQAQANLNHLQSTGSGIDQIKNPSVRGIAKAGDIAGAIAGSVFAPLRVAESLIPGTNEHHDYLVHKAQAQLGNAQANEQSTAKVQQEQALAAQEQAKADAYSDPHKAIDPTKTVQTDDGVFQINPNTGKFDQRIGDRVQKPQSMDEMAYDAALKQSNDPIKALGMVYGAKNQKDAGLPQQYLDAVSSGDTHKADLIRKVINDTQVQPKIDVHAATERPESSGTWSMAFQGDKPVMYNTKTGAVKDAGGITKQAQVSGGPMTTADKNRASLAKIALNNLNHVDEIVTRRPDMFQKMGAVKSIADLAGSNDPDLVALGNEVHNFAMANAGIHGSRNFGNVQAAEQELLNHFKNGQAGIRGGIRANRDNLNEIINPNAPASAGGPPPGAKVRDYTQVVPK